MSCGFRGALQFVDSAVAGSCGQFVRGRWWELIGQLMGTGVVAGALWAGSWQQRAVAGGLGVAPGEARSVVAFWAGLHDAGKIQGFQFQWNVLRRASPVALLADEVLAGVRRGMTAPRP
ncbi:HD domain-containing protein [Streptomyces sp. NBC_01317]|uniref:HD domain-containing protein n=1 Tax=Streptomyces sp. NBC_01317 TaxID=2903822 RepID=UPI003FA3A4E8